MLHIELICYWVNIVLENKFHIDLSDQRIIDWYGPYADVHVTVYMPDNKLGLKWFPLHVKKCACTNNFLKNTWRLIPDMRQ